MSMNFKSTNLNEYVTDYTVSGLCDVTDHTVNVLCVDVPDHTVNGLCGSEFLSVPSPSDHTVNVAIGVCKEGSR